MTKKSMAAFFVGTLIAGSAQATLMDRGGGLIYDDVLNVTWLQDANYAQTSGYDADGRMTWQEAMRWAEGLKYGGFKDWRLSSSLNYDDGLICWGWNCSKSELGHMFYEEFGLSVGDNLALSSLADSYFLNIPSELISVQYGVAYWTSTVISHYYPETMAWEFETIHGNQKPELKSTSLYAWAVRDGDVAAVPEPETLALVLAGLGLLGFMVGRRKTTKGTP